MFSFFKTAIYTFTTSVMRDVTLKLKCKNSNIGKALQCIDNLTVSKTITRRERASRASSFFKTLRIKAGGYYERSSNAIIQVPRQSRSFQTQKYSHKREHA